VESLTTPAAKGLSNLELWCHVAGSCTVISPEAIPAELKDKESPDSRGKEPIFARGSNTKRDSSVGVVTRLRGSMAEELGFD
jgi:hypothetical protein